MTRTVKKRDVRLREIIQAAKELFLEKDYESTSMQDVIEKLQIAKGTVYHYFKSKADLLEAVVQDMVDKYISCLEEALKASKGTALEKMQLLIESGKNSAIEELHKPGNRGMHVQLLAVTIQTLSPLYARLIEQGCEEKLFHTENPLESAEFLLTGIQFLTDQGCYPWSEEAILRRRSAIPTLIESVLKAKKGTFNFLEEKHV